MKKIMVVFGTRPEAIKMIPIIKQIEKEKDLKLTVCTTGQHKDMLNQVLKKFNIVPDYNLDIMKKAQTITYITTVIINKIDEIIKKEKPNIILVHGDTTTSLATAIAAYYNKVKIGHVEAGLRTHNKYSPYPEEMNRVLISDLADIHFAPTQANKNSLLIEGIDEKNIFITGNTVIDAIQLTINKDYKFEEEKLNKIDFNKNKKYILLTAHRRENLGEPIRNICKAIKILAEKRNDVEVIFPVHYNPKVREVVFKYLGNNKKVHLLDPINVFDMHNLMSKVYLVMTDSGGLQEEAPAIGKPVLVLRENTERPEAIKNGVAKIVGANTENIMKEVEILLDNDKEYNKMAKSVNPYGDGHASERIVEIIKRLE